MERVSAPVNAMERRHLAAASGHLHLAAAAYYMAEAAEARAPQRLDIGDIEMGHGGHGGVALGHSDHGIALGHGDHGGVALGHGGHGGVALGHGDHGDGLGHGNADADEELEELQELEELEWTMQDLYDLLLLLASFVLPALAYKGLPQDVVEGVAWTWIVLAYGVFLAVAITTFSVRVLGLGTSTRCLPTILRVLLLTTTVVSEVLAAIYMMPATTLTVVGACFTVVLLLAAHLIACRRHR